MLKLVEVILENGVMTLVVFIEDVMRFPQSGRKFEKHSFYDELKGEFDMHSADGLAMCSCDFNGHVGRHIDGFDEVHGRYGVGQRNLEG